MTLQLPRYVITKSLANGTIGFYFNVPRATGRLVALSRMNRSAMTTPRPAASTATAVAPRHSTACSTNGWKIKAGEPAESIARFGTVDWLFREYKASKRYREHVSQRTRPDYERLMQLVIDLPTKRGDRVGQRPVKSISPLAAERFTSRFALARTARGLARARRL